MMRGTLAFSLISLLLLPASAQNTKVLPLSQCQQMDPMTGGPSVMPFLFAQAVRYLPAIWSAVYSLASERL
jgi:hypothetical protein